MDPASGRKNRLLRFGNDASMLAREPMNAVGFTTSRVLPWTVRLLCLIVFCLLDPGVRSAEPGTEKPRETGDEIFSSTNVLRIQIEIPKEGIEQLRRSGFSWNRGGTVRDRPEVQAIIREGDRVYTNVAAHLKGAAGSFQPIDSKPSFTLNFDKHVKGQRFHGLQKISLNNYVEDPTFLSYKTGRELFNAAGIPAPRADYATVELNGRKLGLYVLLEGYNRQFLKRHFKNSKGNLYDGGFIKDIDAELATNTGEETPDYADLNALVDAANEPASTRLPLLEKSLDLERFITFVAMEVLLCHWDGYSMNKNNYRIYHDPDSDRLVFMPHGMDQICGVMMVRPDMQVKPPFQGLVAKAIMSTPQTRRRYFERLRELNLSLFNVETLTNRILQTAARLTPVLSEMSTVTASNHRRDVEDFAGRVAQRKQSLEEQLAGAQGKILDFNEDGIAPLSGWTTLTNAGRPLLAQSDAEGRAVLYIRAAQGASVASWRTKVMLEEGHYRFEGRMQTKGVVTDPRDRRAGAGLRAYAKPALNKTRGDSEWRDVAFEFDVPEGLRDIDLVCELRAAQGEVWFDAQSLRLVRQ